MDWEKAEDNYCTEQGRLCDFCENGNCTNISGGWQFCPYEHDDKK